MGLPTEAGQTRALTKVLIQERIDALLIAWQYAGPEQKTFIHERLDALQIALDYAA